MTFRSSLSPYKSVVTTFLSLVLLSTLKNTVRALDIEFDKITCDQTLPAYVSDGNLQMTCNNGNDSRCSFGTTVAISGVSKW
jgi:hypothetical protein